MTGATSVEHEVADGVAQEDVLGREVEVHDAERTPGQRASDTGASLTG